MDTNDAAPSTRRHNRRLLVLTPLVALLLLMLTMVPGPGPIMRVSSDKPWCLWDPGIPEEAYRVERFARTHNFAAPPGLKGNKDFEDRNKSLPFYVRPLLEYDVYPQQPGERRPPERVLISRFIPTGSWYSPDHYVTFVPMFPVGCVPRPTSLWP